MSQTFGLFNDSFPPIMDGVAQGTRNIAYWLNKKYGKCYVITPHFPKYTDEEEFDVLRYPSVALLGRKPYRMGMPGLSLDLDLDKIPFDLVHAKCPFSSGRVALRLARRRNIPLVASFHSRFYDDFKSALKSDTMARAAVRVVVEFFQSADAVWAVSEGSARTLRDYGYVGAISIVENGIDFAIEEDFGQDLSEIDWHFGLKQDVPVLLYVGQIIQQKNLAFLMEALHHAARDDTPFTMLFVGEGQYEQELKEQAAAYGLTDRIRFTGVIHDRDMLHRIYARANLFMFPSLYDTFAIVVREAASVGCPSLLIRDSDAGKSIKDGYNGFLADHHPAAYAKKLKKILSDLPAAGEVGRTAQATLCRSWEEVVDDVYEEYQRIIADYRRRNSLPMSQF